MLFDGLDTSCFSNNFSRLIALGIVLLENIPMVRQSCLKSWSVKALMLEIKGGPSISQCSSGTARSLCFWACTISINSQKIISTPLLRNFYFYYINPPDQFCCLIHTRSPWRYQQLKRKNFSDSSVIPISANFVRTIYVLKRMWVSFIKW